MALRPISRDEPLDPVGLTPLAPDELLDGETGVGRALKGAARQIGAALSNPRTLRALRAPPAAPASVPFSAGVDTAALPAGFQSSLTDTRSPLVRELAPSPILRPIGPADSLNRVTQDSIAPFAPTLRDQAGAVARGAVRGTLPALGGAAAFGPGFVAGGTAGVPIAPFFGPAAPAVPVVTGLAGGILSSMGGAYLGEQARSGIDALAPGSIKAKLGQDAATLQRDRAETPTAAFAGELAPNLLFMRPGLRSSPAAPDASLLTRTLANPVTGAAIGGTLGGGIEAGVELSRDGQIDPGRVAVAAGIGALLNRPTRLGEALIGGTGSATIAAAQAGARAAGTVTRGAQAVGASLAEKMRNRFGPASGATIDVAATPYEAPGLPAPTVPPVAPEAPPPAPVAPVAPAPPIPPANLLPLSGSPVEGPLAATLQSPQAGAASQGATSPAPVVAPEQAPLRPEPGDLGEGESYVTTPAGNRVRARFEVVPAASLKVAEGELQNRDRSRDSTDIQVQGILANFDPSRLGQSAESDRGAPIVGPDGIIESGNGRMMALNRIFAEAPDKAAAYRAMIEAQGLSTAGIENPVLIRRRTTEFTPEQRRQFVLDSNADAKLALTSVERARGDADALDANSLALFRGGDIAAAGNAEFVRNFAARLPPGEQGAMVDAKGQLSQDGIARVENALMARAYENPDVLSKVIENRDNNIRSIGGAMLDTAAPWATFRAAVRAGEVKPEFDVTDKLVEAARIVSDLRARGEYVKDYLASIDAFNPLDPVTEQFIRAFYNSNLSRAAGRDAIGEALATYARRAGEQTTAAGLFGDEAAGTPLDILQSVIADRDNAKLGGLFQAAEDRLPTTKEAANDADAAPRRNEGRDDRTLVEDEGQGRRERRRVRLEGEEGEEGRLNDDAPDYSEGRPPAPAEDAGGDRGAYQPSFMEASFTNRSSLYEYAVTDIAGITPDEFRLKSPEAQVALLQRGMAAKFGMKVAVDPQLQRRFAIDQMLDAYQNLQGMAHVLGIAPEAIGLGGQLSLRLEKKVRALGWFQPGKNVIGLPKRSNSFAHEWGHALDWHLLELYGGDEAGGRGLTGDVRKDGADFEPKNVRDAFVAVLNAMFFDEAAMAAKIMVLERRIAATESDAQKARFQSQIDNFRAGRSRAPEKSEFYKGARVLDRGPDGYFASPTEMHSRAFEAYISYQAERRGLGTEFIGKGDANYLSNAEERFAKSFPKGAEREAIFNAFDNLFVELNRAAVFGDGASAAAPRMNDLRRISDFDKLTEIVPQGGLLRREMAAIEKAARQREKELAGRPNDPKTRLQKGEDVLANIAYSMTGLGRMMERRYPNAPAIRQLMDKLTYREGMGGYVGEGFESAARARANTLHNRLAEILRRHGLDDTSIATDRLLRDLLIGETVPADTPAAMKAGAADLRRLLDEEFYANQNAGLDIGYARNGFLPRILDFPLVLGDEPGFVGAAGEVYKAVFDQDIGADPQEVLAGDGTFPEFMKLARRLAKAGLVDADAVKVVRDIAKKLAAVDDSEGDGAGISAELQAQLEEALAEIFDPVRDAYAAERASAWLNKIKSTSDADFDAHAPDGDYTKNRTLPPEADKIMEAFYIQNPIEAVQTYLSQSARRTTYAKLFGANGEKRKEIFDALAAQGVDRRDQAMLSKMLDIATGRTRSDMPDAVQGFLSFIQATGTITLLPRAVLSSLTEAITAGLRTGDMRDGMKSLTMQIAGSLGSANGKHRRELARALGIVADSLADEVNAARFGGTFGDSARWTKLTGRMFVRTGLTGLTRAQRTHMLSVSNAYLDLLSNRLLAGEDVPNTLATMRELGIRDPETWAAEMASRGGKLPSVEDVDTPFGIDYGVASRRFIDQTIQNPTLMDRPLMTNNPIGRVMFGIMSFSYSFWRNVLKRNAILLRETAKRSGGGAAGKKAAGLLGAAALLFAMQGTVSTIREYLLNRKRWDELDKKGDLEKTMLQLAATRSFSFGAADPVIQGVTGLKYQRDFANIFIGAAPGYFLQGGQKMVMPFINNSDKTNTAEYNAAQGFYSTFAAPALAYGLMSIPGGPIIQGGTGALTALGTAPVARDAFATAVVGEKDRKKRGGK